MMQKELASSTVY